MENKNQTTYIGIRGHRGAGKPTVSYLLAGTIDYYLENRQFDDYFEEYYSRLVDEIVEHPDDFLTARAFDYVYLESFSDTQRVICSMVLGIDIDHFYNEFSKNHMKVQLSTLEVSEVTNGDELVTACEKLDGSPCDYMTLREFCSYFSLGMQQLVSPSIWIHSLEKQRDLYISDNHTLYKIFYDVKLPTEVDYIVERDGYIVRAVRPGHQKDDTSFSTKLNGDRRVDFEVVIDGDDMLSCKEDLKEIAQIIIDGKASVE